MTVMTRTTTAVFMIVIDFRATTCITVTLTADIVLIELNVMIMIMLCNKVHDYVCSDDKHSWYYDDDNDDLDVCYYCHEDLTCTRLLLLFTVCVQVATRSSLQRGT